MKKTNSEILHFFFADATPLDKDEVLKKATELFSDVSAERLLQGITIIADPHPFNQGDQYLVRSLNNNYFWLETGSFFTDPETGKRYFTLDTVDVDIKYQDVFLEWFAPVLQELMYS